MAGKKLQTGPQIVLAAIELLKNNGSEMRRSELVDALEPKVSEDNKKPTRKGGRPRWIMKLDCQTGHIRKENLTWYLTEEAEQWYQDNLHKKHAIGDEESDAAVSESDQDALGQDALGYDIAAHIKHVVGKNTGEKLEKIVAALLRGMGYSHVDNCGRSGDGGIDVIAYQDQLGAVGRRVKVQAKHYTKGQKISADDIKKLASMVHQDEIGVFITTSSFAPAAKTWARDCEKHLLLVDIDRLVTLWIDYYPKMSEQDKELIPLVYKLDTAKIKQRGGDSEKTE